MCQEIGGAHLLHRLLIDIPSAEVGELFGLKENKICALGRLSTIKRVAGTCGQQPGQHRTARKANKFPARGVHRVERILLSHSYVRETVLVDGHGYERSDVPRQVAGLPCS